MTIMTLSKTKDGIEEAIENLRGGRMRYRAVIVNYTAVGKNEHLTLVCLEFLERELTVELVDFGYLASRA